MNGLCHTYEYVMSHMYLAQNVSCHTYKWVMSHIWLSHVINMNALCIIHVNASCHAYAYIVTHTWMSHVCHDVCHDSLHTWLYTCDITHVTHDSFKCVCVPFKCVRVSFKCVCVTTYVCHDSLHIWLIEVCVSRIPESNVCVSLYTCDMTHDTHDSFKCVCDSFKCVCVIIYVWYDPWHTWLIQVGVCLIQVCVCHYIRVLWIMTHMTHSRVCVSWLKWVTHMYIRSVPAQSYLARRPPDSLHTKNTYIHTHTYIHANMQLTSRHAYGVATISRLLKIKGLFCKGAL